MPKKRANPIGENKIDPAKNTQKNIDYYNDLCAFFDDDPATTLLKLRSFALYAPRQVMTDYLVRFELFKLIVDVPGSIMEFGVFNGQGLLSYAQFSAILEPNNISRKIYGFDTFAGFQGVSKTDTRSTVSSYMREGDYGIDSYERIRRAVALFDANRFIGHVGKVELVPGDVRESLDAFFAVNQQIIPALVHLDMDLYEPTKHVLERVLKRMPKGAVVVFDELNVKDFPGETVAALEVLDFNAIALRRFPFCSRISYFVV